MSSQAVVTVSTTAQLLAALKAAHGGEIIQLQSGSYSSLVASNINVAGGVTIESQKSSAPATLAGFNLVNCTGLSFQNISLSVAGSTDVYPLRVNGCTNVNFSNINVSGSLSTNGFYINNSSNISITSSHLSTLATAITELNNNHIGISNNTFNNIRSDGIDNGGSSYVGISGNTFTNFHPASSTQHPDAIQFWTTNTTSSAHDISITGNTVTLGSGGQVQGIFMKDEVGTLPYSNVTISGNNISGELWNGISVDRVTGLSIQNNNVTPATTAQVQSLGAGALNSTSSGVATSSWIAVADSDTISLGGNNSADYLLTHNSGLSQNSPNMINGVVQTAIQYSTTSATLGPLSSELVLTGNAQISGTAGPAGSTVVANNAGDHLYDSAAGSNTLIGGNGNDVLISRSGADTLTGGGGNNTFQIKPGITSDVITDFGRSGSHNTLDLSAFISAGLHPSLNTVGTNTVVSFAGSSDTITLLGVHANQLSATATGFTH